MRNQPERCYCGDPACQHCFPFSAEEPDPDEGYDKLRQQEIDDAAEDLRNTIVDIATP